MRKALAVMLIGGSLALGATTAFAESDRGGGGGDGTLVAPNVTVALAAGGVLPVATTTTVPDRDHEGRN